MLEYGLKASRGRLSKVEARHNFSSRRKPEVAKPGVCRLSVGVEVWISFFCPKNLQKSKRSCMFVVGFYII